jgi:hypothetical protein
MIKTMMYLCFSSYIYQHESEREFPIAKEKKKADGLELFFLSNSLVHLVRTNVRESKADQDAVAVPSTALLSLSSTRSLCCRFLK